MPVFLRHLFVKRFITIFILVTVFFQTLPVLHLLTDGTHIFYTVVTEEAPAETEKETKEEKKEDKIFSSSSTPIFIALAKTVRLKSQASGLPPSPHTDLLTPPPDVC